MLRRIVAVPAAILALSLLTACGDDDPGKASDPGGSGTSAAERPDREPTGVECDYPTSDLGAAKQVDPPPTDAVVSGDVEVTFETSFGTFTATLDADAAPCTVNSFVSLADQNYFNATDCHRLTTSGIFVLQCGDPTATGTGGPGYTFADELDGLKIEADGSTIYTPGTLAMANAGPNTNGSQFFIVYDDTPLSPNYTAFGTVSDDGLQMVKDLAAQGSNDANGPGDGKPNDHADLEFVTAGPSNG